MLDLSGMWLGTYWQEESPVRFQFTLVQAGNSIIGNILDDNYLGEALISGEVVGRRINFTKKYISHVRHQVNYLGAIAEEGNFMQGQWRISSFSGLWEAHRQEDNFIFKVTEKVEILR
jgi:hypothetical protein